MTDQEDAIQRAQRARREESIQQRFEAFHRDNPRVYSLLVRFARYLKGRGWQQAGIGFIWERMRWEIAVTTKDPDGFKLNDHYRSRYARMIMDRESDLDGFFRTRRLTSL
jgi:hypothetical protein